MMRFGGFGNNARQGTGFSFGSQGTAGTNNAFSLGANGSSGFGNNGTNTFGSTSTGTNRFGNTSGNNRGNTFGGNGTGGFTNNSTNTFGNNGNNAFGSNSANTFGNNTTNTFGTNTTNTFGNTGTNAFGNNGSNRFGNTNAFGNKGNTNNTFGNTNNAFGNNGTNTFGNSNNGFGSTNNGVGSTINTMFGGANTSTGSQNPFGGSGSNSWTTPNSSINPFTSNNQQGTNLGQASFGNAFGTQNGTTPNTGFTFGNANNGQTTNGFGSNPTNTFGMTAGPPANSNAFSFGNMGTTNTGGPAAAGSGQFSFGAPATTTNTGFSLGQPAGTSTPFSLGSSTFGQPTAGTTQNTMFGGSTFTNPSAPTNSFSFGTTAAAASTPFGATTQSSPFSFGASTTTPQNTSGQFSFGTPGTTTPANNFSFGTPAATGTNSFSFGQTTSTPQSSLNFSLAGGVAQRAPVPAPTHNPYMINLNLGAHVLDEPVFPASAAKNKRVSWAADIQRVRVYSVDGPPVSVAQRRATIQQRRTGQAAAAANLRLARSNIQLTPTRYAARSSQQEYEMEMPAQPVNRAVGKYENLVDDLPAPRVPELTPAGAVGSAAVASAGPGPGGVRPTFRDAATKLRTTPSMNELGRMASAQLARVEDFTIRHAEHGSIRFLCPVDIRGAVIDELVQFSEQSIEVYPADRGTKPARGLGLNQPAEIVLVGCRPKKGSGLSADRYREKLQRHCRKNQMRFLSYNELEAKWFFAVDGF